MRGYAFTLAIVGVAATVATIALNAFQPASINLHSHHDSTHHHAPVEVVNNSETEFAKYVSAHGKSYSTQEEYEFRFQQFLRTKENIAKLQSMNSEAEFGFNQFSDWTEEEYKALLGLKDVELQANGHVHHFD